MNKIDKVMELVDGELSRLEVMSLFCPHHFEELELKDTDVCLNGQSLGKGHVDHPLNCHKCWKEEIQV